MSQTRDHAEGHGGTGGSTGSHASQGRTDEPHRHIRSRSHSSQGRAHEPHSRSRSHMHGAARGGQNGAHHRRVVTAVERARAYLARMPVSVQGQGGHLAAFKAASTLVNGFALGVEEALPLLLAWNAQCLPPWREADLRYKLRSAASHPGTRARGYLLGQDKASFSASASASPASSSSSYSSSCSRRRRLRQGEQPASAATEAAAPAYADAAPSSSPLPAALPQSHPAADAHGRHAHGRHAHAAPASVDQETVLRETRKTASETQALQPSPPSTSACEMQALPPSTTAQPQEGSAGVSPAAFGIAQQDTASCGTRKTACGTLALQPSQPKTASETQALRPSPPTAPQQDWRARVPRAASSVQLEAACGTRQHPGPDAQESHSPASLATSSPHPAARQQASPPPSVDQETVLRGIRKTACGTQARHPSLPQTACGTQALRPNPPSTNAQRQESSACVPHATSGIAHAQDTTPGSHPASASGTAAAPPATAAATASPLDDAAAEKSRQRARWPVFQRPTPEQLAAIAMQRGLPLRAVELAALWGFLVTAVVDGHACYLLHEGTFAQARRLDGQPFKRADGTTLKTKNLPGSEGAFLGRKWTGRQRHVLLVEGCIGLVEAIAAWLQLEGDAFENWTLLAATSASTRFARDPELLATLRENGCQVRILPDNDPAGLAAAMSWAADLRQAGIQHGVLPPAPGCKDLGDILALRRSAAFPGILRRVFGTA